MERDLKANPNDVLAMEWFGIGNRLAVLARYKWWIVAFTLIASMIGGAITMNLASIYSSKVTLLLENTQANVVSIEEIYGVDSSRGEYYLTQYEIIKSRKVADAVIEKLDLTNNPEFSSGSGFGLAMLKSWVRQQLESYGVLEPRVDTLTPEERAFRRHQSVLGQYNQRLTLMPVRNTQLVQIQFEAEDPQLAADIANAIGEAYIQSHLEDKLVATQDATGWMRERLEKLKDKLRASELSLQQFRDEAGLVDVAGLLSLEGQQLEEITTRLSKAKARRSAAEAVTRSVSSAGGRNIDALASLPEINRHPSIQQLRRNESAAEQRIAQLSNRYGPKHKTMISAKAELVEIRTTLRRQIRQLVDGIQQEYRAARNQEASLVAELAAAKNNYQGLSKNESRYRELQREVETNRQLYDTFLTRIKETGVAGDFNEAIARVTEPALPALKPSKPKKPLILVSIAFAAAMLSAFGAMLHARYVDVISRAAEVEKELAAKLLGIIPDVKMPDEQGAIGSYFSQTKPEFGEAWRSVRTAFTLQNMDESQLTLAISSADPGEGKTTSAISLAQSLQLVKRVLLVDCDLRRPAVGKAFGIPTYQPGLTNVLNGTHTFEQCVYSDEGPSPDILTAGTALSNPLETLSSEGFATLLEQVRKNYDVIVLDTPPVQSVSDGLVVGRLAGSMLFVVRADHTRAKQAKRAIARILENKILLSGVVLNRVAKDAMAAQYGDRYDSYYGHGYDGKSLKAVPKETAA